MRRMLRKANWITLALCVGVIQVSAYYFAGATVRPDGCFAVAQPDSALYLQAARRIVAGFPFSYSTGEGVCTGTTSVIYPFVLAIPYALGLSGAASVLAAFALNAVFYLVFIFCWACVIDLKVRRRVDKVAATFALAVFGQFGLVSLAQSDTGIWLAVFSVFVMGLAKDSPRLYLPALIIGPWVRPEGMACVIAFAIVAFAVRRRRLAAVLALFSLFGVFAFNWWLTGAWHFASMQGKGHFASAPFCQATVATFKDSLTMLRQIFLGFPSGTSREMFFIPVLSGFFFFFHVFTRDYSNFDEREAVCLLAYAGGFAMVAASGWQGTNYDRYLAWLMPVAVVWTALGAMSVGRYIKSPARFLPIALLLCFGVASSAMEVLLFRIGCEACETDRAFYERCERILPQNSSVGGFGNSAGVHWLSPRRFAHLSGIYSPEFSAKYPVSAFEVLKREPETRFDWWICDSAADARVVTAESHGVFGDLLLLGPHGLSLRRADWRPFDAAAAEPAPPERGLELRARVDVGYEPDERAANYEVIGDYLERAPLPVFRLDKLGGALCADVGRVVTGGDRMVVSGLVPGRDVHVVMRTVRKQRATSVHANGVGQDDFTFVSPMTLTVDVDGCEVGNVRFDVPEEGFADVTFVIAGAAISSESAVFSFKGDHAVFCYWLFQ